MLGLYAASLAQHVSCALLLLIINTHSDQHGPLGDARGLQGHALKRFSISIFQNFQEWHDLWKTNFNSESSLNMGSMWISCISISICSALQRNTTHTQQWDWKGFCMRKLSCEYDKNIQTRQAKTYVCCFCCMVLFGLVDTCTEEYKVWLYSGRFAATTACTGVLDPEL